MYDSSDGTVMLTSSDNLCKEHIVCVFLTADHVSKLAAMGFSYATSQWSDRPYLTMRVPKPLYSLQITARDDKWGIQGEIMVDNPHVNMRGGYNHFLTSIYSCEDDDGDCIKVAKELIRKSIDMYREYNDNLIKGLNEVLED